MLRSGPAVSAEPPQRSAPTHRNRVPPNPRGSASTPPPKPLPRRKRLVESHRSKRPPRAWTRLRILRLPSWCCPGWLQILMVGIRSPDGLVVGSCTSHPGVLGSISKREEPGKTGAPCVKVPGSSRVPLVRDGQTSPHKPLLVVSRSTCPPLSPPPRAREQLCNRSCNSTRSAVINCT